LAAAHAKGVLHRDLKPNNIMITGGKQPRAVIMDFGLAAEPAQRGSGEMRSSILGGALDYLAPELLNNGEPSKRSDLYSLGVVLYEMVTGRLPFEGGARGSAPAPGAVTPGLSSRWKRTLLKCLEEAPGGRFQTADEVASSLTGNWRRAAPWAASVAIALGAGIAWPSARDAVVEVFKPQSPPATLAILPFQSAGGDPAVEEALATPLRELAAQLGTLRLPGRRLNVLPLERAVALSVRRPEHAAKVLGATHALHGEALREGGRISMTAGIYDAHSLHKIREFSAKYPPEDVPRLARALVGMAAAAFHSIPAERTDRAQNEVTRLCERGIGLVRRSLESADQAVAEFKSAIALDAAAGCPFSGLAEAYCSKYQLTRRQQWLEAAAESLAQAEIREPDTAPVRLASARLSRLLGQYEKAIGDYIRVTELDSNNAQAHVGLALTYMTTQRNLDAIAAFEKALELNPKSFLARLELGHLHHRQGRHNEAKTHLVKAVEIDPASSKAHSSLGALYVDMGEYTDAEAALRQSIQLEESDAALIDLGAALSMQGRDPEAIEYYERALAAGSEMPVLFVNLADAYRRIPQPRKARASYRRALAAAHTELVANPNDAGARAYVGYLNARLGDRAAAEREMAQAFQLSPADAKVRRRTILTLECLGQRDKALDILRGVPPGMLKEIDAHPDLGDLRADERYQAIKARTK
jgi:serine/threonine-protein kinase